MKIYVAIFMGGNDVLTVQAFQDPPTNEDLLEAYLEYHPGASEDGITFNYKTGSSKTVEAFSQGSPMFGDLWVSIKTSTLKS